MNYPYPPRGNVAQQRADRIIRCLGSSQYPWPRDVLLGRHESEFYEFLFDHAHMPSRGSKYPEQYEVLLILWNNRKKKPMTITQVLEQARRVEAKARDTYNKAVVTADDAQAAVTEAFHNLTCKVQDLQHAEGLAKADALHKAKELLLAAGYAVTAEPLPTLSQAFGSSTKAAVAGETAISGGGKGGSITNAPKQGGVHGVGEGWYVPVIYMNQVKIEHDFAINTRDHHEAGNKVWLKHIPSGRIIRGFPTLAEGERWIRGYQVHPIGHRVDGLCREWCRGQFEDVV